MQLLSHLLLLNDYGNRINVTNQNHNHFTILEVLMQREENNLKDTALKGGYCMVMVGEWKPEKGVQAYTITGTREEIYTILDEVREAGGKYADTPNISRIHNSQYHVLLKLKIPV